MKSARITIILSLFLLVRYRTSDGEVSQSEKVEYINQEFCQKAAKSKNAKEPIYNGTQQWTNVCIPSTPIPYRN
jgi:hypothetical protein